MIKSLKKSLKNIIINSFYSKKKSSQVLCYHSISDETLEGQVAHRISKVNFTSQLRRMKRNGYTFLPIDEYLNVRTKKEKVTSVTFDDGYRDLCTNAAEVLVEEQIPFTLYLNGCLLSGETLWRDKVRILIENELVSGFQDFLKSRQSQLVKQINWDSFYRSTKSNGVNSKELSESINTFFKVKSIDIRNDIKYVRKQDLESLPGNLFTLGNHTMNHYRLSTLSAEQVRDEIKETHDLIQTISCKKSNVFSIPFGGNDSFNQEMVNVLCDLNYIGFLTTDTKPFVPEEHDIDTKGLLTSSRVLNKNEP